MDLQNMDLKGGSLQISTEVIGKIARCAALEVDGVSEVSCGKQNKKVKELLAAASIQPPVTVEMRDGTAELTLNLVVKFGAKIPAVAEKVQENVKGVYVLYGGKLQFVQVFSDHSVNGYAICKTELSSSEQEMLVTSSTIQLYDQVVVEGTDLYDGKIIE